MDCACLQMHPRPFPIFRHQAFLSKCEMLNSGIRSPGLILCDPQWPCGLGCTVHKFLICLYIATQVHKPMMLCQPTYPLVGGWEKWFQMPRCRWPYGLNAQDNNPALCLSRTRGCVDETDKMESYRLTVHEKLPTPEDVTENPQETSWFTNWSQESIMISWARNWRAQRAWLRHVGVNLTSASNLVPSLMSPTAYLTRSLTALKQRLHFVHPIVAIHVRRGDAKLETVYHPLEKYFEQAQRFFLSTLCSKDCNGRRRVFLMSDSRSIFEEASRKYVSEYEILSVDEGRAMRSWHVPEDNALAISDVMLASQADYFIGTATSQLSRLVVELLCSRRPEHCFERVHFVDGHQWSLL